MKEEKKLNTAEPTITDVMVAVQKLSGRFDALENTNKNLDGRFDVLESSVQDLTEAVQTGFERHEKILNTLVAGQENLTERVNGIDQRLSVTQGRVEDVVEMIEDMTEVVDESRDLIFDHERRIKVLEKVRM